MTLQGRLPGGGVIRPGMFRQIAIRLDALARNERAETWLGILAFTESLVFPLPVETMLVPMTLSRPERWRRLALIATVASVTGGLWGYALGHYGAGAIEPVIAKLGYEAAFDEVLAVFARWGFLAVLIAGFSPLPYKLFTIGAGLLALGIVPFALASVIGRGLRFVLVAGAVAAMGPHFTSVIEPRVEAFGWALAASLAVFIAWSVLGR